MKKIVSFRNKKDPSERRDILRLAAGLALSALVAGRLVLSLPFRGSRSGPVKISRACTACMGCVAVCPTAAIQAGPRGPVIAPERCVLCGYCTLACPVGALKVLPP